MRPTGSPKQLAARRRKALELLDSGLSPSAVARQIGCKPYSVTRWARIRDVRGDEVFHVRTPPGRPRRLTVRDARKLVRLLTKGAVAHGYRTDLWTTQRIAELIEKHFGVAYHRDHIGRLMASLGWSYQKPERRAKERNEAEIERWKREEWPRVKKTPKIWAPTSSSLTNPGSPSSRPSARPGRPRAKLRS